jgi:hypothetical protein
MANWVLDGGVARKLFLFAVLIKRYNSRGLINRWMME